MSTLLAEMEQEKNFLQYRRRNDEINRKYREFVERLGVEMVDNYSKYLPYRETEVIGDDDESNDFVTYLIVTDHTKGDLIILDGDKLNDIIIWIILLIIMILWKNMSI